jgi:hypothetical protein
VTRYDANPNATLAPEEREVLLARYLAGALDDVDAERFEAYWAEHPELTRDVEASARVKTGLADLNRRGELAKLVRGAWWSRGLLLSIAAGVAALGVGLVTWQGSLRDVRIPLAGVVAALPGAGAGALPVGATVSVLRLRGAAAVDATLRLPEAPAAIRIRVLPEQPSPLGRYRLELTGTGDTARPPAGVAADLVADADGFVSVYADARALRPGRYRLVITPAGSPERSEFAIDVRAAAEQP